MNYIRIIFFVRRSKWGVENWFYQELDDYETKLGLHPIWIKMDKAIEENEEILKDETNDVYLYNKLINRALFIKDN